MSLLAKLRRNAKAATTAVNGVNAAIAETRADVLAAKNALSALEQRPAAQAAIVAELDRGLAALVGKGAYALTTLTRNLIGFDGEPPTFRLPADDLPPLMAKVVADHLRAAILTRVAEVKGGDEGLTDEQRDAERERLERELLTLELAEEAVIREAERAGLQVQRRRDMHPAAFLAPDGALPRE